MRTRNKLFYSLINQSLINISPTHLIPIPEFFLFFRRFPQYLPKAHPLQNGHFFPKKENRDENIPDLPNLTAYEDYTLLKPTFYYMLVVYIRQTFRIRFQTRNFFSIRSAAPQNCPSLAAGTFHWCIPGRSAIRKRWF